jgi:hypothetical protein
MTLGKKWGVQGRSARMWAEINRHFPDDIIFNHSPYHGYNSANHYQTGFAYCCFLGLSQVLIKKSTNHLKNDFFDITGAVSIPGKDNLNVPLSLKFPIQLNMGTFLNLSFISSSRRVRLGDDTN